MKRIFAIFSIALLAFAACEGIENVNGGDNNIPGGDGINNKPHITIAKTEISVGSGVAMSFIRYELVNPKEGLTLEATSNVEWIGNFDYKDMGKIGFKTQSNPNVDSRVGVVTVTYGESSIDVTITQEANPQPTNITVEAPMLTGHYYGANPLWNGLYNFYLAFSDKGFSSNEAIYDHDYDNVPDAYYYFVDLYLGEFDGYIEGEPINVPNGTYQFDKASQGWPNTFVDKNSWLQYNDAGGFASSQNQIEYDKGELIVEDGKVTLKITLTRSNIQEEHTVIYEGDYTLIDMSGFSYHM